MAISTFNLLGPYQVIADASTATLILTHYSQLKQPADLPERRRLADLSH